MDTITQYVKKYGEYTFSEKPLSDVDSLVLCQFCYLKFDALVPDVREKGKAVSLRELAKSEAFDSMFADVRYEKKNRALFDAMVHSKRFGRMKVKDYINIIEPKRETQFSAVTFFLEDGTMYVAYRGTDENIVGWKEDFNMALEYPVPGQEYALKYLNAVAARRRKEFYLGGHSKGGNLAVYAAMNCKSGLQERIIKVYSMDGPGFQPNVLEKEGYKRIEDRIVKILPHSSLVGMLFETAKEYKVVESKSFGPLQHDLYTWLIEGDDFLYVKDIYGSSRFAHDTFNEWVYSLDDEKRRLFVDTLYQVVAASKAQNMIELGADWKKSMNAMITAMKEVDPKTRRALKQIVKALFDISWMRMRSTTSRHKTVKETK